MFAINNDLVRLEALLIYPPNATHSTLGLASCKNALTLSPLAFRLLFSLSRYTRFCSTTRKD